VSFPLFSLVICWFKGRGRKRGVQIHPQNSKLSPKRTTGQGLEETKKKRRRRKRRPVHFVKFVP